MTGLCLSTAGSLVRALELSVGDSQADGSLGEGQGSRRPREWLSVQSSSKYPGSCTLPSPPTLNQGPLSQVLRAH